MFADLPWNAINDGELSWDDPQVQEHIRHLDRDCEWYEDEEGFLYIVDEDSLDLVHGPDNEMSDAIFDAAANGEALHRLDDVIPGLCHVSYVLRRFSDTEGFYHA